ncbi:MAG: YvcK family protein, partial [Clostridiales bacterium]|nr:YvcK family protein [Clostridiales bacterium]
MKKNDVPKIVALGGGTGLSTMLRGLKKFTPDLTAVVTVADDGGGSGVLRQDLGMLPPGDIRNCIVALAQTEPLMTKLLQYRFDEGCLAGQCFGNLFLAAMYGISKNFEQAVQRVSDVLRVTGRVLPVTVDDVHIEAELESGEIVIGESKISRALSDGKGRIKTVRLVPSDAEPLGDALREIEQADIIVLGPGSLYTSIIPNLIVRGVADAVMKSGALKIY